MVTSVKAVFQQQVYDQAKIAQKFMRQCYIKQGMMLYERVIAVDLVSLFCEIDGDEYYWQLSSTPDQPCLNWICVFVGEYFIQRRNWYVWNHIADVIFQHSNWKDLSDECQSSMLCLRAWGQMLNSRQRRSLNELIAEQKSLLHWKLPSLNYTLHHMIVGNCNKLLRNESEALLHLYKAEKSLDFSKEPFYYLLNQEFIGDTYYFLNKNNSSYYDKARNIYQETEQMTQKVGERIDFTSQAYNLGWIEAEVSNYDLALIEFKRGYFDACNQLSPYEQAQYQYGLGYVYLMLNQDHLAKKLLEKALHHFYLESNVMATACLHLLASIEMKTDKARAIELAHFALSHLQRADHPVLLHHTVQILAQLYKRKNIFISVKYFLWLKYIQFRYRIG